MPLPPGPAQAIRTQGHAPRQAVLPGPASAGCEGSLGLVPSTRLGGFGTVSALQIVAGLYLHRISGDQGIGGYDGLANDSAGSDDGMVPDMRSALDETVRADEHVILDEDVLPFGVLGDADAALVRIGAIDADERGDVAMIAD